ncbi:MAG: HAD-IIA family hydrolase [Candidatus Heimdallarchaeota archaeon]|nr:HAD-IIA family hydrolase [Candidatus Heimdallarchaeota archaeon]
MDILDTIAGAKMIIFDADGCLVEGGKPLPGAVETTNILTEMGKKVLVFSNNSTRHPETMMATYTDMGFSITNVLNSGYLTVQYLLEENITSAYVVGEKGLVRIIEMANILITTIKPQAVVVGMDRALSYQKITTACSAIRAGARFVGTNPDTTFPTSNGLEPGAGTIIAALVACSDTTPEIIIGKPNPWGFEYILKKYNLKPQHVVMIGDRFETDMIGALNSGMAGIITNTGVAMTRTNPGSYKGYPDVPVISSLHALFE